MRPIFAVVSVLAVAACQTTSDAPVGEQLSPAQIMAEWSGRSLQAFFPNSGRTTAVTFNEDWSLTVSVKDFQDNGTWRLSYSGYCSKWTKIREGKEECYIVRKNGSEYRIYKMDRALDAKATLI